MTTLVNFKLAKLLKQKDFPLKSTGYGYSEHGNVVDPCFENVICEAPTIAEAVTWLYEKFTIWIFVASKTSDGKNIFIPHGRTVPDTIKNGLIVDLIPYTAKDTPTEAYESAIEYCLTNITER